MELILYENAKRAVAQLQELDEVVKLKSQAQVMEEYMRRARDKELEIKASEYRMYCEHRAGEMSKQLPTAQGARTDQPLLRSQQRLKKDVLKDAGISTFEKHHLEKFSEVPIDAVTDAAEELKGRGIPPTRKRVLDVHYSSESVEHYTPDAILERVYRAFGSVSLDPCSDSGKNVAAGEHFTVEDDGLSREWFGSVFMNPPYGVEIKKWTRKLREEYEAGRVEAAIALLPSRTDTEWFHELSIVCSRFCFIRGRLSFIGNTGNAPFPSVVCFIGIHPEVFDPEFQDLGLILG